MQKLLNETRTIQLLNRLERIARELREITAETGANIRIQTDHDKRYESPCSVIWFGERYIYEHLYIGTDVLKYDRVYNIEPEEVLWTRPPEKFEARANK